MLRGFGSGYHASGVLTTTHLKLFESSLSLPLQKSNDSIAGLRGSAYGLMQFASLRGLAFENYRKKIHAKSPEVSAHACIE